MRILVTGGSGFIGQALCRALLQRGDRVTTIASHSRFPPDPEIPHLAADTRFPGAWQQEAAQSDAIVNLAGRSIHGRWTERYKRDLYDSRILTTRNLVTALPEGWPGVLLSASAVGYYGDRGEAPLTEADDAGRGFLAELSRDWEREALQCTAKGCRRVVLARFGIVLGLGGGALQQLQTVYRMFAGGPIGEGSQWFPWIHMHDLVAALRFILEHDDLSGPLNLCAPEPIRNRDLAALVGRALNRPALLRTPAMALRLALGEMAEALLASQRVLPRRLLDSGFRFRFSDLASALADLLPPVRG
jgi:hypothetical protein